jgi:glycosyltransferase involved in cell wall biosynthesis
VVWPISQWSADDLIAFWSASEKADSRTMPPVVPLHLPGEFGRERTTEFSPVQNSVLCFGTLEPRKNQLALIHAFRAWRAINPDGNWRLELVGNLHPLVADELHAALAADPSICYLGPVSDDQLAARLKACAFTVFPSVEEGFGLPILESLWAGKPCLCANFGAMGEIAKGGGCLAIDVTNQTQLTAALGDMIEDRALRTELTIAALSRPISGWSEYADSIQKSMRDLSAPPVVYYWINSTRSFPHNTGIQRVVRQLARGWMEQGARLIPVRFDRSTTRFEPATLDDLDHLADWNGPAPDKWSPWVEPASAGAGSWFVMAELPHELMPDQHAALRRQAHEAGLGVATVFHDATPYSLRSQYPEFYGPVVADRHRDYMLEVAKSDLVLAVSEDSANDLKAFLDANAVSGDPRAPIISVPLGGEFPQNTRVFPCAAKDGQTLNILCVGTIEPRKNHATLLRAFELALTRTTVQMRLVLAGRRTDAGLSAMIEAAMERSSAIVWVENADDRRLRDMHLECDFTIFPSVKEGFGLPILESLWHGKPVICADFGAMEELALGGGCLMVDVKDVDTLASAIVLLAEDPLRLEQLRKEASERVFSTWSEYALSVAHHLSSRGPAIGRNLDKVSDIAQRAMAMGVEKAPVLSVCISTYNRAEWLAASLKNWSRLCPEPINGIELLVVDNASTDHTSEVVKAYTERSDFRYRRNSANVGMLGNLRETAYAASGDYIWILGDDDLIRPGAIEYILRAIADNPGISLLYLNYEYTRMADARGIKDFDQFFREATPIVPAEPDRHGKIKDICARNENFFTAIYTLVFRRDHALGAYSQDTSGRPFSTMLTAIPTTYYVLNRMMEEPGLWIGAPQVVVNMNVSWMKYAPLWILERVPEVYEVARAKGVSAENIDRWRRHTLPGMVSFFKEILRHDPLNNAAFVCFPRVIKRFTDLPEFASYEQDLREAYAAARAQGSPAAQLPVELVFPFSVGMGSG